MYSTLVSSVVKEEKGRKNEKVEDEEKEKKKNIAVIPVKFLDRFSNNIAQLFAETNRRVVFCVCTVKVKTDLGEMMITRR